MGDPKFPRRQYERPFHPWKAERIAEEGSVQRKFGLKNKREVWRAKSWLRTVRGQARELSARVRTGQAQARLEADRLIARLNRLGLMAANATLDDVLALDLEKLLTRRLQTQVYLKGLSSSVSQARQFIVHHHITIDGGRVNVPGHLVTREEERSIGIDEGSAIADEQHPVRPKRTAGGQLPTPRLVDPKPPIEARGGGRGGPGRGPPRGGPGGPRRGPGGPPSGGGGPR